MINMASIRIDLDYPIYDGCMITFKAPCDCNSEVDGIRIYCPDSNGSINNYNFVIIDTTGHMLTDYKIFRKDAYVTIILDTVGKFAYMQNTNRAVAISKTLQTYLYADKWNGNYYYFNEYPKDKYDIFISLDGTNSSKSQKEAFDNAEICGCASQNIIRAFGEVPTIDLCVVVRVVEK
jgi:hypothetical protein